MQVLISIRLFDIPENCLCFRVFFCAIMDKVAKEDKVPPWAKVTEVNSSCQNKPTMAGTAEQDKEDQTDSSLTSKANKIR